MLFPHILCCPFLFLPWSACFPLLCFNFHKLPSSSGNVLCHSASLLTKWAISPLSRKQFLHFHAPFSLSSIDYSTTMVGEKGRNPETLAFQDESDHDIQQQGNYLIFYRTIAMYFLLSCVSALFPLFPVKRKRSEEYNYMPISCLLKQRGWSIL